MVLYYIISYHIISYHSVSTRDLFSQEGEFTITVDKTSGTRLGVDVDHQATPRTFSLLSLM